MRNKYTTKDDITEIYIASPTHGHFTCLVDTVDLPMISKYSWCINKESTYFYCRSSSKPKVKMHNLIMNTKPVDHINHNTLDNRRSNLRHCTHTENMRNSKRQNNNSSGYKGVTYCRRKKRYLCQIIYNNKNINLGYFKDKKLAAIVYDLAATLLFKDFAHLNFPNYDYNHLLDKYDTINKLKTVAHFCCNSQDLPYK